MSLDTTREDLVRAMVEGTAHNLAWLLDLVHRAGAAIRAGTLADLRAEVSRHW